MSGTPSTMEQPKTRHVRATRAFFMHGKVVKAGDVLEMDRRFASELYSFNKVEYVEAPAKPAKAPEAPKPATPKKVD